MNHFVDCKSSARVITPFRMVLTCVIFIIPGIASRICLLVVVVNSLSSDEQEMDGLVVVINWVVTVNAVHVMKYGNIFNVTHMLDL